MWSIWISVLVSNCASVIPIVDSEVVQHCFTCFGSVLQSSKVLAKKELSYMPIIGWMWYFLEIVFCKRKWEEDRKTVVQKLLNLRDYPENFWVSDD